MEDNGAEVKRETSIGWNLELPHVPHKLCM